MDKEIKIGYQPNTDELIKVSKYILFNLSFIKYFIPLIVIIILLNNILSAMIDDFRNTQDGIIQFGLVTIILLVLYFSTISSIKKNILANKKNTEFQTITFSQKSYLQEGETFRVENFWNEMYQIKETKSWFLIYQKKNMAFPIIKAELKDNQYNELKELFNSLNIKKSLK